MARIRTVKPEFWEDEKVASLSFPARLLFIASWNFADDAGVLRWSADYVKASVFMYDTLSARKVTMIMAELEALGLVVAYDVPVAEGKSRQFLAYIPGFLTHQRINRPQPSRFAR